MTPEIPFHPPVLLRLFRGIDQLPPGATGALVFTGASAPQGTVLVEDNRVCWAAASNMDNRLTDLLRFQSNPPLPAETFEEVFEACRLEGKPLGETLLKRGLVTTDGLWRGLRQHTAEAIAHLSSVEKIAPVWSSNRKRRYDARFTFCTAELVTTIASFGKELEAREAERRLAEVTPAGAVGLAYLVEADHDLPLAHVAAEEWHARSLAELGSWARSALAAVDDPTGTVLASDSTQALKRAWRSGDLVFVRYTSELEDTAGRAALAR